MGAVVGFPDLALYALTDTAGDAIVNGIPPGVHRFEARLFGYRTEEAQLSFAPGSVAAGDVALAFQPIPIEEIMVAGRSRWSAQLQGAGFYERAGRGIGYQLDRVAIRDENVVLLSELLRRLPRRSAFTGFVNPSPDPQVVDFTEEIPMECAPTIFVDGIPWSGYVDDLPLLWVEGLELFTSPTQVPTQYLGGGAFCGLLLVWTG